MERPERKQNRLKGYDYSQPGYYFVTICVESRDHILWYPPSVGAACGRPLLTVSGQIVEREIQHLNQIYPMVTVEKYIVMPNHIHLLIGIRSTEDGRPQAAPTLARILNQFKGAVTKQIGHPIWQKGYHDHIIRNEADYQRIWLYIDNNPARWREDVYFTEIEG